MKKVLFISHCPHKVHLEFAKSVGAKIKISGMNRFVSLSKKFSLIGYLYPFLSWIYSLFIKIDENILLVDGGSSLYLAVFLKMRYPKLKIIFLNGDMILYFFDKKPRLARICESFFYNKIDAVISVSEQNKEYVSKYLDIPSYFINPYPKKIRRLKIERKNYGLYIGRLDPDKKIKRIVEFGLQCPYFEKFIIIGNGAYKGHIQKIAKKNKKILYFGKQENLSKPYNECKFLIHIPDYDPHPCTTMEASLCGCFPIISKGTGSNYLFDKIFIIDNPDNFEEINKRVKYILDNKNRAEELLEKAIKKFPTKKKSIKNFKKYFNDIIKHLK